MSQHQLPNSFLHAIGNVLTLSDFSKKVYSIPNGFQHPLPEDGFHRQLIVETVASDWFLPEPKHYRFYKDFHRILHHSFSRRSRKTKIKALNNTEDWLKNHKNKNWVPTPLFKNPVNTISLFGSPGMGKSVFWDHVLSKCFDQVVEIDGELQVNYLIINCSAFNSLKAVGSSFFAGLDAVLTTYYHSLGKEYKDPYSLEYIKDRYSAERLLPFIANIAAQVNLGVLVVDEINHLTEGKRDPTDITKFFKNMTRAIGIPIIMSGTPNALKKLGHDVQALRRLVGLGLTRWKFYKEDSVWKRFMNQLWKFEVTVEKTELTEEMMKIFFELTAGVMDFAIKVFIKTQTEAIERNSKVNESFVKEVYDEFFDEIRDAVAAIKSKDPFVKRRFVDIQEDYSIIDQLIIEDEFQEVSRKIAGQTFSEEQAGMIISILRHKHPSISEKEINAKVKKAKEDAKNANQGSNTLEIIVDNEPASNHQSAENKPKKASNETGGELPGMGGTADEIKAELDRRGMSGKLDSIIDSSNA